MDEYKSEVKKIYHSQESVYGMLSDMSRLSVVRERLDDPQTRSSILKEAGGKLTPEQLDSIAEKIKTLQVERDFVAGDTPAGHVTLRIAAREEPKTVKYTVEGAPIQADMWIQLISAAPSECAMRVTLRTHLNFFVRQMIGGKLQDSVNALASMLANIPYES